MIITLMHDRVKDAHYTTIIKEEREEKEGEKKRKETRTQKRRIKEEVITSLT